MQEQPKFWGSDLFNNYPQYTWNVKDEKPKPAKPILDPDKVAVFKSLYGLLPTVYLLKEIFAIPEKEAEKLEADMLTERYNKQ